MQGALAFRAVAPVTHARHGCLRGFRRIICRPMPDGPPDQGGSDQPRRDTPRRPSSQSGGLKRTSNLDPQDLSSEWALQGCESMEFEGREQPTLGRIALLARLGRGGMGVVYYGVNPRLGTEVAVKVVPRALQEEQEETVDRFVREARLAAQIRSDHLITVLDVDYDETSGAHFLVMEYVRGVTAADWISKLRKSGRVGAAEKAALAVCVAASKGLAAAHLEGILHRDVKPENILIPMDDRGRLMVDDAKISDLGLARPEVSEEGITATSIGMGTPGYMAPEQARDARTAKKPSDVFGMGATLYALLTGEPPFTGPTAMEVVLRTLDGTHREAREIRTDLSEPTSLLLERCLALDPARRFPDALALLDALQYCRQELRAGTIVHTKSASRLEGFARMPEQGKAVVTPSSMPGDEAGPAPSGGSSDSGDLIAVPPRSAVPILVALLGVVIALTASVVWWIGQDTPQPPGLLVGSSPPGASVYVDDRARGSTPVFLDGLSGTHAVRVEMPDYRTYQAPAVVIATGERKELSPVLDRIVVQAGLKVTSDPTGADVEVDGDPRGRTPLFVPDLAYGLHTVRVELPNYESFQVDDARVQAEASTPVHAVLARAHGMIAMNGGADRGRVTMIRRGEPPRIYQFELTELGVHDATDIEAGEYDVEIERDGFDSFSSLVTVRAGVTEFVDVEMQEHDGFLTVTSDPPGAEVRVAGRTVGTTPITQLSLAAGTRNLVLRLREHAETRREVRVRGGKTLDLGTVALEPWNELDLSALADGVSVEIDGSPAEHGERVPPGRLTAVVKRPGYAPQPLEITQRVGTPIRVAPRPWTEFQAVVDLASLPEGTQVVVDGKSVGVPTLTFTRDTQVAYRLVRAGFEAVRGTVSVALGERRPLPSPMWAPVESRLDLTEWGADVQFTLRREGRANRRLDDGDVLAPGDHLLYATRRGGKRIEIPVSVVSQRRVRPAWPRLEAEPIVRALGWLATHQSEDGRWDCDGFGAICGEGACLGAGASAHDVGVTGLALECFARAGRSRSDSAHGPAVRRAVSWLLSVQAPDGGFGPRTDRRFLYDHAAATTGLAVLLELEGSAELRAPLERAVQFLVDAQSPGLGWRYGIRTGGNDTSSTGWMIRALTAAQGASIAVPDAAFAGARQWVDTMTDAQFGRVGYQQPGGPPHGASLKAEGRVPTSEYALEDRFPASRTESLTAVGVYIRLLAGESRNRGTLKASVALILRRPPIWDVRRGTIDLYYWYYATRALYVHGGDPWKTWSPQLGAAVLPQQGADRTSHDFGSFAPSSAWGSAGGRVYATAILCLALQDHLRLDDAFRKR